MFARLLSVALLIGVVTVAILYNAQIVEFSDAYLAQQEVRPYLRNQNYPRAIEIYENQVKAHPGNLRLAMNLASLYGQQAQIREAEALYQQILQQKPDHLRATLAYAKLLKSYPARVNEAIVQYRKALQYHGYNPVLLREMGHFYKQMAETLPDKKLKSHKTVRPWLYEWAIYYYRHALQVDPNQFSAQFGLGVVYQASSQPEKSATQYCNALLISPNSYEARYNLGLVLVDLGYLDVGYRQLDGSVRTLTEQDQILKAQQLAEQVQKVKNSVFNDPEKSGLQQKPQPDFLNPDCLNTP